MHPDGIGVEMIADVYEVSRGLPDDHPWRIYDLEDGHRRLAHAARELIVAYESWLHPDWSDNSEKAVNEIDALSDKLEAIAERSDLEVAKWRAEKKRYQEFFKVGRGPRRDSELHCMVVNLIRHWRETGGHVGGGSNNGKGGPLIRFLQNTTRAVLEAAPTTDTVRHWIREFKRWEKDVAAGKPPWR